MGMFDNMAKTMLQGFINSQISEDIGIVQLTKFDKSNRYLEGNLNLRGEEKPVSFNFNYDISISQEGEYYFKIKNFFADRIWINNAVRIYQKKEGQKLPSSAGALVNMLL